ncbi:MAG: FAD-dependent oxidoreductase [Balneolaceae bacterium]|nr:FAD-dependent oxidoreductase [Balneolaceae bacterium]
MANDKPFIVLGQGIAGVSLVWALMKQGVEAERIVWVGQGGDEQTGASWTPVALINPATGPSAKLIPDAEVALSHTYSLIDWFQTSNIWHLSTNNTVLRPAASQDMCAKMKQRFEQDPWPEGWAQWLEPGECAEKFPGVFCAHGALWIHRGGYLPMPSFLAAARQKAADLGVQVEYSAKANITQWLDKGTVICATGAATSGLTVDSALAWPNIGLHRVKGQLMTIRLADFDDSSATEQYPRTAISMKGYLAPTETPGVVAVGSTYEHHFEHTTFDEHGRQKLLTIAKSILPNARFDEESIRGWAAIRVHQPPERLPVITQHSTISGLYAFTGFGSKGLTLAPAAAVRFTQRLLRAR